MLYRQYFSRHYERPSKGRGIRIKWDIWSMLTMLIYYENINAMKQSDGQIGL